MQHTINIIYTTLALVEKVYGKPAVMDPESGAFYISTGEGLIPVGAENEYLPLSHFQAEKLLSLGTLRSLENDGILRGKYGFPAVSLQAIDRKSDGQSAEKSQENSVKFGRNLRYLDKSLTEKRAEEVIQQYNLQLFSHRYTGKIRELAEIIEDYTIVILYKTKKRATIDKTRIEFRDAAQLAAKGKDIELEKLRDRLIARRENQRKVDKMNATLQRKADSKRIKTLVIVGTLVLAIMFAMAKQIIGYYSTPISQEPEYYTHQAIDSLIEVFREEDGVKVYQWRRQMIKKYLPETFTKEELREMCNVEYEFGKLRMKNEE